MLQQPLSNLELEKYLLPFKNLEFRMIFFNDINNFDSQQKLFEEEQFIILVFSQESGQNHFTTMISRNKGVIEFFDSFGNLGYNKEVIDWSKTQPWIKKLIINKQQLQHFDSNSCGIFVISRQFAMNTSIAQYIKLWSKNHKLNETKLMKMYSILAVFER